MTFSKDPFIHLSREKSDTVGSQHLSTWCIGQDIRLSVDPVKKAHLFLNFYSIYPFICLSVLNYTSQVVTFLVIASLVKISIYPFIRQEKNNTR